MKKNNPEKMVLATTEAETLIQRIARNVAWYALRIARPGYLKAYPSVMFTYVNKTSPQEVSEYVHWMELQQSADKRPGDNPPVPLHHVIFRG